MKNKEGKEESSKRGMIGSEKREGEMTNKVEKEKTLLVHFASHPFRPFFRFGLPSLPWFFLSLFIVHLFLPSLPWFFLSLFILQAFLL